ncbi:MAG: S41 family peptidase [Minicystis sp.]
MLRSRSARALAIPFAGLVLAGSSAARAGSFTADGTFLFDPTAVDRIDFEDVPMSTDGDADGGTDHVEDPGALSGKRVLTLAPQAGVDVPVTLPKTRQTYRVSAWIRDGEVTGSVEIYYGERVSEVAGLYPTGRITSDGWIEIGNDHLRIDGERLVKVNVGLFSAAGAVVDAIEIVADGGAEAFPATPNAVCNGITDASACAADQICMWSECRNVAGWVPPIPADRDAVTGYLTARAHLLFGPYLERSVDMPAVDVYLDQMRHAKDRWTYWNAYLAAVRRLHDGHTSTSGLADFVLQNPRPLALCFLEGDADLSHDTAPKDPEYLDVLVSHVGADHNLGLHAGDRLVAIDGRHPVAWARSLESVNWGQPGISNHTTYAELVSALRGMIARYAASISVVRCDPEKGVCGAIETISIKDIPADPPGTMVARVTCDNRPLRHLASAPPDHRTGNTVYAGLVSEADPSEKIYGLEWESLYTTNGTDGVGAALKQAVASWKSDARGVILDHRTGFGGTILAPEILWNFFIPRRANDLYVDRTFAEEEQPDPADAQKRFNAALNTFQMQYVGSTTPNTNVPVALLLTEDVSASDWLAEGMKGGPRARLFAPFQTNGGFSTRYAFGYWLSMGYVMAVGDDIMADGSTHNGRGVEPDVVVLPKQSESVGRERFGIRSGARLGALGGVAVRGAKRAWGMVVGAALAGCTGGTEELNPLPVTTSMDAGTMEDAGTGGAPDAGTPKRTVMQRNPFGNVAETENLLWDGDFEWYSPFSDQYGWLAGSSPSSLGFSFTDVKLGAECRSGIRCAWLKKKKAIAGIAVASAGNKLEVSFWAHVTAGPCGKVKASLIEFQTNLDADVAIQPVSDEPDAEGWCHYDSIVDPRKGKPALYIQNGTDGDVLVDDAVIKKVPATMSLKAYHGPLTPELAADLAEARAALQRARGPHDSPPNAARRAYEQWKQQP